MTRILQNHHLPHKPDIRLVYFDVDGTLLNTQGVYSTRLKQQIQRIRRLGIKTAIASGRPSYAAQFLFDDLAISDVGVFCTGAHIYNPATQEHIQVHNIEQSRAYAIVQRAKALGVYCEIYTIDFHAVETDNDITQIHAEHLRVLPKIMSNEAVFEQSLPIIKLLLGRDKNTDTDSLYALEQEFPDLEFAYAHFLARPTWEFASVISPEANKKTAFDNLLTHYDLKAEQVMAIGDSQSDKIFIQSAGIGIAMGNASNDLQQVANYVTKTNDQEGVAFALERLT